MYLFLVEPVHGCDRRCQSHGFVFTDVLWAKTMSNQVVRRELSGIDEYLIDMPCARQVNANLRPDCATPNQGKR